MSRSEHTSRTSAILQMTFRPSRSNDANQLHYNFLDISLDDLVHSRDAWKHTDQDCSLSGFEEFGRRTYAVSSSRIYFSLCFFRFSLMYPAFWIDITQSLCSWIAFDTRVSMLTFALVVTEVVTSNLTTQVMQILIDLLFLFYRICGLCSADHTQLLASFHSLVFANGHKVDSPL